LHPEFDALSEKFQGDDFVLVGEINCMDESDLCKDFNVAAYPMILTGNSTQPDMYLKHFNYAAMYHYVKEKLRPQCSPSQRHACDEEEKVKLDEFLSMPLDELDLAIEEHERKLKEAEDFFRSESQKLGKLYLKLREERETVKSELDALKIVLKAAKKAAAKEAKVKSE